MSDYQSLIERVEGLSGPDRVTDDAIKLAIAAHMFAGCATTDEVIAVVGGDLYDPAPAWTASIDAALSLVERKLPGWHICLSRFSDGWYCTLAERSFDSRQYIWSQAPTGAISIIAALLRALQPQEETHG